MDKKVLALKRKEVALVLKSLKSGREDNHGDDGKDKPFNPATFLYIRAYNGDMGARPVPSGITYWLSPDIEIYKKGVLVDTASPLQPGVEYTVRVTVRNDGDLDCNTCTVDLYITHPSIGFAVGNMSRIGLASGRVSAHSYSDFDFNFTALEEMCGHKCMFARAYSLSNNDFPEDWDSFYSHSDRHIGQQNINIVKQGETVNFNVIVGRNLANRKFDIIVKKHIKNFTADKSVINKFVINTRRSVPFEFFEIKKFEFVKPETIVKGGITIPNDLGKPIEDKVGRVSHKEILKLKDIKRISKTLWRETLREGTNKMNVKIPNLGLNGSEAVPISITVTDPATEKVLGGITWLVTK